MGDLDCNLAVELRIECEENSSEPTFPENSLDLKAADRYRSFADRAPFSRINACPPDFLIGRGDRANDIFSGELGPTASTPQPLLLVRSWYLVWSIALRTPTDECIHSRASVVCMIQHCEVRYPRPQFQNIVANCPRLSRDSF